MLLIAATAYGQNTVVITPSGEYTVSKAQTAGNVDTYIIHDGVNESEFTVINPVYGEPAPVVLSVPVTPTTTYTPAPTYTPIYTAPRNGRCRPLAYCPPTRAQEWAKHYWKTKRNFHKYSAKRRAKEAWKISWRYPKGRRSGTGRNPPKGKVPESFAALYKTWTRGPMR